MRPTLILIALCGLSACATPTDPSRETDFQRLARECRERGGILVASQAPLTGRAEVDNLCQFHGPPERR
jgi:hypothetical protein